MSGIQMLLAAGGKGITYPNLVSSQTANHAASADITITAPTSITSGNLLVAFICQNDQGTGGAFATPPSGFTRRSGINNSASLMVYTKTATGSEPASYTWSGAGTAKEGSGCLLNYSSTGYDTSGNSIRYQVAVITLTPDPASLTVAKPFSTVFYLAASEDAGKTIAAPSGYSTLFSNIGGSGQGGSLWVFYKNQLAAGNSGSPTTTLTTSGQGYVLMAVLNGT
jgi:hypothetical protein